MSYFTKKDQWGVIIEYTAQNSYGALLTGEDIEYFYNDLQKQIEETKKAIEKYNSEIIKNKELIKKDENKEPENKSNDLEFPN